MSCINPFSPNEIFDVPRYDKKLRGFEYTSKYFKLYHDNNIPHEMVPLPTRKTKHSAGYDFFAPQTITLFPGEYEVIATGVKAFMQPDEYLAVVIRSSYGIKKHLRVKNVIGVIDSDYYNNPDNEGDIMICLVNEGSDPVKIPKGEAFAQGIFMKYLTDGTSPRETREGGIGSTDK